MSKKLLITKKQALNKALKHVIVFCFVYFLFYITFNNITERSKTFQYVVVFGILTISMWGLYNRCITFVDFVIKKILKYTIPKYINIIINKDNFTLTPEDFCDFSAGLCKMYELFIKVRGLERDKLYIAEITQEKNKFTLKLECKYPEELKKILFFLSIYVAD